MEEVETKLENAPEAQAEPVEAPTPTEPAEVAVAENSEEETAADDGSATPPEALPTGAVSDQPSEALQAEAVEALPAEQATVEQTLRETEPVAEEEDTGPAEPVEAPTPTEPAEVAVAESSEEETAADDGSAAPLSLVEDQRFEALPSEPVEAQPAEEESVEQMLLDTEPAAVEEVTGLKAAIEAIVYVTEEPASAAQIAAALERPEESVTRVLNELVAEYARSPHGIMIREVAGGYKMTTKPEHHDTIRAFVKSLKPPLKLSLAALETLATIAYKQPITAPEIMEIRGVQGAGVLKTLLDRKLIQTAGRKNVIGRPILYKTTKEFLVQFGLKDLSELPTLKEFEELRRLAVSEPEPESPEAESPAPQSAEVQAGAAEAAEPAAPEAPPAEVEAPEAEAGEAQAGEPPTPERQAEEPAAPEAAVANETPAPEPAAEPAEEEPGDPAAEDQNA